MKFKLVLAVAAGLLIFQPDVTFASKSVLASWYKCCKVTANGEKFDPLGFTVAHRTLPFGTILKIRKGNKFVVVRVNDRGPYIAGRELDLTKGVARALGCIEKGICRVSYRKVFD